MPPLASKRKHSDLTQSSSTQRTTRSMAAANPDIHILADGIDSAESPASPSKRQRMAAPSSSLDFAPITPISQPRNSRRRVSRDTNTHTLASAQDSLQLVGNTNNGSPSRPRVPLRRRGPTTPTPASKTHNHPANAPLGRAPSLVPTIVDDDEDDDLDDEDDDENDGLGMEPSMTHFIGAQDSLECVEDMLRLYRPAPPRRRVLPAPSPLSLGARLGPPMPTPAPSSPLHPSIQNIDAIEEEDADAGGEGFGTPTEPASERPRQHIVQEPDSISRPITPITNTPSPSGGERTSLPPHPLPPLPSFPALPSIAGGSDDQDMNDANDTDKGDSDEEDIKAGMNWAALCLPAPSPLYNHTKDPVDLPRSAVLDAARDARRAYRKHLVKAYKYYTRVVAAQHALARPRSRAHTHPRPGKGVQLTGAAGKKAKSQVLREKPRSGAMGAIGMGGGMGMETEMGMGMGMGMGAGMGMGMGAGMGMGMDMGVPPQQVQPKPPSKVQVQQQVQPVPFSFPPQQVQPKPPSKVLVQQQVQPVPFSFPPQQMQPKPPSKVHVQVQPKPQLHKLQTPQRKKLSLKEQKEQQRALHMSMERMGSLTLE